MPDVCEEILGRLAAGQTLREICRSMKDGPTPQAVRYRVLKDEEFAEQYARARELGIHEMIDETVEIADDGTNDWVERNKDDGSTLVVPNQENIARSRLRVDTRKWLAGKIVPKLYGDKIDHNLSGSFSVNINAADSEL